MDASANPPSKPTMGRDGSCLICGSREWTLVVRSEDVEYHCKPGPFDVVECDRCGHTYVHPLPSYEEIPSIYPNTYYTVNKRSPLYLDGQIYEMKLASDARKLALSLAKTGQRTRSVVDVGAGEISRLVELKKALETPEYAQDLVHARNPGLKIRFNAAGAVVPVEAIALDIQFDEHIVEMANANGIVLLNGNVETDLSKLRDNGHDLIIMRQLIEHLRDPRRAVAGLAKKMAPGGLMIIDTPNRGGWDYKLFRKQHWGGYHIPRHFHLFRQNHLVKLIEGAGLEVFKKAYLPSMGFWIISLRNMLGLNSIAPGPSPFEFLRYKNLPLSAFFILLDTLRARLGLETSNQLVIARKPVN